MSKYKLNPVLFNKIKINSALALNMSLYKNYLLFLSFLCHVCQYYSICGYLIFLSIFPALKVIGIYSNLFIILLKSSQIFAGFRKLTFFHTFPNIPMDKCTLGVHKIKLMIKAGPSLRNCSSV